MKKNEVALPSEINEVLEQSSLTDLTKAQEIAINYAPLMESVTVQMSLLQKLEKGKKEDVSHAKRIRLDLGKICSLAEKQKKEDKDVLLLETRFIDALFNTVNGAARLTQTEAKEIENHFEAIEEKRLSDLQDKRVKELSKFVEDAHERDLSSMDEDVWEAYFQTKKQSHIDLIAAEKKAEEDRVALELKQKIFDARKLEIAKHGDHATKQPTIDTTLQEWAEMLDTANKNNVAYIEEQAKIRKENERLKKESEAKEKALAKERELAEKVRLEVQKKAEDQLKKEREAKEKIEKELKAKKETEELAEKKRAEAEEAELSKGDADKVKDLISDLEAIKSKYQFKSKKNKEMFVNVQGLIDKVTNYIKK